ncbi:MAG: ABC transporter ATP-binding protein/permease [Rhodospirillales bacterium]|nr:ABC transporter ATP-binding protein/permease [Rhodospirillales bacterium]
MMWVAGASAVSIGLLRPILDDVLVNKNQEMLWLIAGAIFVTFTVKGIADYAQSVIMSWVGQRILTDTQIRLYNHLMCMDLAFFHGTSTGKLLSRFTTDINMMRFAVQNTLTAVGKDATKLVGFIGLMFYQDAQLSLIAFIVIPAAIIPISRLGKRMRKVTANNQVQQGEFITLLEQTFQGIRHVKAYGMADYEKGRVRSLANVIFDLFYKAARIRALSSPIMESLAGIGITLVIVYGGLRVIDGVTTVGEFFTFIAAALSAYEPAKRLANLNANLQEGLAGADRLFVLLDIKPSVVDKPDAKKLNVEGAEIALKNVSFAYDPVKPALTNITLTAPAGQTVALVGPSGAGKSTVLNLIPRFYDIDSGSITIDDQDVSEVTMASLRSKLALVSQEITLFDDTVRANIKYGRSDASEEDVIEAAKNAAAHDFIQELPKGYDTIVGEHGVRLSGGQRQRLAIARAMLKNAPILLLDEATSALDTESERKVQVVLQELMKDRTTLVIAHRLSTVVDADIIYVIDQGAVLEQGTHKELLDKNGAYAKLYALQFADEPGAVDVPAAANA